MILIVMTLLKNPSLI